MVESYSVTTNISENVENWSSSLCSLSHNREHASSHLLALLSFCSILLTLFIFLAFRIPVLIPLPRELAARLTLGSWQKRSLVYNQNYLQYIARAKVVVFVWYNDVATSYLL
jgi:hypothetical protein